MDKFSVHLRSIISGKAWGCCVAALIIINTIVLGMETYPSVMNDYGDLLTLIDQAILSAFILELVLRVVAYRLDFCVESHHRNF